MVVSVVALEKQFALLVAIVNRKIHRGPVMWSVAATALLWWPRGYGLPCWWPSSTGRFMAVEYSMVILW